MRKTKKKKGEEKENIISEEMGAMKMETKKGTRELIGQMTGDSQQSIFLIIMKTIQPG